MCVGRVLCGASCLWGKLSVIKKKSSPYLFLLYALMLMVAVYLMFSGQITVNTADIQLDAEVIMRLLHLLSIDFIMFSKSVDFNSKIHVQKNQPNVDDKLIILLRSTCES